MANIPRAVYATLAGGSVQGGHSLFTTSMKFFPGQAYPMDLAADEFAKLTVGPIRAFQDPDRYDQLEVVHLHGPYIAGTSPATVERGQEGTTAKAWANKYRWISGAYASDFGQRMIVRDEKPSGTDGGDFLSGAWRTRTLNTVGVNGIPGSTLIGNQITLPPGLYEAEFWATAANVDVHVVRLRDVTHNLTLAVACVGYSPSIPPVINDPPPPPPSLVVGGFGGNNISHGTEDLVLAATSTIELQHQCETTQLGTGRGRGANFGEPCRYAEVVLRKRY